MHHCLGLAFFMATSWPVSTHLPWQELVYEGLRRGYLGIQGYKDCPWAIYNVAGLEVPFGIPKGEHIWVYAQIHMPADA